MSNLSKEVKKKLQHLVSQLYMEYDDLSEAHNEAVSTVVSDPQFRGVLKHIVDNAVAEATVKVMTKLL